VWPKNGSVARPAIAYAIRARLPNMPVARL
jgi:hypothetical protein